MIVKLLTSEIWSNEIILALSAYVSGKFLSKKENPHSFTTPRAYPTKDIC